MDLPIYDISLSDYDAGIFATSLVEAPATESEFVFFSKSGEPQRFFFGDEEKREVVGAVVVPDKLIYRKSEDGEEFYVRFTKDIIKDLNAQMHEYGLNRYFTVEHELDARESVKFIKSWIKETEEDRSVALGINEPIGTLFMKVKIESDLLWKNIKDGNLKGFSIELDASRIKTNLQKQNSMDFTRILKNELTVGEVSLRFNSIGVDEIVVDMAGDEPSFYEGTFEHDGNEIVVADGVITTITELQVEENDAEPVILTADDVEGIVQRTVATAFEGFMTQIAEMLPNKPEEVSVHATLEEIKLELKQNVTRRAEDNIVEDPNQGNEFNTDSFNAASNWKFGK